VFKSATYTLLLDREKLILKPKAPDGPGAVHINEDDELVNFGNHSFRITYTDELDQAYGNPNLAIADAGLLVYPLILRTWQQGDNFVPLGMTTRKKLSDFFINQKIPLHQKTQIPLLVNGNGEVIWITGYRLSNRYKLTPQTKKVIIFELLKP
jgi:tRNA(Ile)-lysidine synthase